MHQGGPWRSTRWQPGWIWGGQVALGRCARAGTPLFKTLDTLLQPSKKNHPLRQAMHLQMVDVPFLFWFVGGLLKTNWARHSRNWWFGKDELIMIYIYMYYMYILSHMYISFETGQLVGYLRYLENFHLMMGWVLSCKLLLPHLKNESMNADWQWWRVTHQRTKWIKIMNQSMFFFPAPFTGASSACKTRRHWFR